MSVTTPRVETPLDTPSQDPIPEPPLIPGRRIASSDAGRDGARVGATVARAVGILLTAVLVGVGADVTTAVLAVGGAAVLWIAASTAWMLRRGLRRGQATVAAAVDLLFLLALVALTGGVASPAAFVLWLAPPAWGLVYGAPAVASLVGIAAAGYTAMWIIDHGSGPASDLAGFQIFVGVLVASSALALVALHLRLQDAERTRRLLRDRAALMAELGRVEGENRARTSRILHDGPLQLFIAARQDIEDHRDGAPEALRHATADLEEGIVALRAVVSELHDAGETPRTVAEGLDRTLARHRRRGRFAVRLDLDPAIAATDDAFVVDLVGELVANAAKHAAPRTVHVVVGPNDDGTRTVVEVRDDGRGMTVDDRAAAERAGHVGLRSMDRRVRAVGGRWLVRS
ncbi:sensor histidine kinase, partial [Patulibacter sp. S7RM1-6]